jgi:hypothetical protein
MVEGKELVEMESDGVDVCKDAEEFRRCDIS